MNAPRKVTFLLSLILGGLGIVGKFVAIPYVSAYAFYLLAVGFVILLLGCMFKGL